MTQHNNRAVPDTGAATCSLAPGALGNRVDEWRSLTAQALHREIGPGRVLSTYPNNPDIARGFAELIDAEKECCPFLQFDVQEHDTVLRVQLRYPSDFAPSRLRAGIAPGLTGVGGGRHVPPRISCARCSGDDG
jgi:hypothetical protein